jgi:DNA repair photolyase
MSAYDQTYQSMFGVQPPASVHYGESGAEIIRPARGFVDQFDLTMQTQVGCPGGCLFCYVPSGYRLTPQALRGEDGENWGFEVRPKRDVEAKFAAHLAAGDLADKTLYWSGVTDPYATRPAETRALWEMLCAAPADLRPRRVVVQTRYRPDRDVLLIQRYYESTVTSDGGPPVVVSYSIGTDRDDLIRAWERATPSFGQRFSTIKTLRGAGIWVVPTLSPFGLWNDLRGTLEHFREWGIPYITCLFFKRGMDSANTPNRFVTYLMREYPQLLDKAWQREQVDTMQSVFGLEGVLLAKAGFASLPAPHRVIQNTVSP